MVHGSLVRIKYIHRETEGHLELVARGTATTIDRKLLVLFDNVCGLRSAI